MATGIFPTVYVRVSSDLSTTAVDLAITKIDSTPYIAITDSPDTVALSVIGMQSVTTGASGVGCAMQSNDYLDQCMLIMVHI